MAAAIVHDHEERLLASDPPAHAPYERSATVEMVAARKPNPRLLSLDAFRGAIVCLMILTDDAGAAYRHWMDHSPWSGLRLADIIMPGFLFAVGCSTAFAIMSQRARPASRKSIAKGALKRCARLVVLGLILQGGQFPNRYSLYYLRIPGILQRIAVVYITTVAIELLIPVRQSARHHLARYVWQYVAMLAMVTVHGGMIAFAIRNMSCDASFLNPTPDCSPSSYWDMAVFGVNHLYHRPEYVRDPACSSCSPAMCPRDNAPSWCSVPFDPEGILSTIASITSAFVGLQFAHLFIDHHEPQRISRSPLFDRHQAWFIFSFVNIVLGVAALSIGIPINKNVYSLSYLCLTSALNIAVMAILYELIERKHRIGVLSWLISVGRQAVLVYALGACDILDLVITWVYWERPNQNLVELGSRLCRLWLGFDLGLITFVVIKIAFWVGVCMILHRWRKYYTI